MKKIKKLKVKSKFTKLEKCQYYFKSIKGSKLLERAASFRIELVNNETNSEILFKGFLIKLREKYEFQKIIWTFGSFYIIDFYLPNCNVVIELDGNHHYDDQKMIEDEERTQSLLSMGIKAVYRFKNLEVYDFEPCIKKLKLIIKTHKNVKKSIRKPLV